MNAQEFRDNVAEYMLEDLKNLEKLGLKNILRGFSSVIGEDQCLHFFKYVEEKKRYSELYERSEESTIVIYLKDNVHLADRVQSNYIYGFYIEPTAFYTGFDVEEEGEVNTKLLDSYKSLHRKVKKKFCSGEACLKYDLMRLTLVVEKK